MDRSVGTGLLVAQVSEFFVSLYDVHRAHRRPKMNAWVENAAKPVRIGLSSPAFPGQETIGDPKSVLDKVTDPYCTAVNNRFNEEVVVVVG